MKIDMNTLRFALELTRISARPGAVVLEELTLRFALELTRISARPAVVLEELIAAARPREATPEPEPEPERRIEIRECRAAVCPACDPNAGPVGRLELFPDGSLCCWSCGVRYAKNGRLGVEPEPAKPNARSPHVMIHRELYAALKDGCDEARTLRTALDAISRRLGFDTEGKTREQVVAFLGGFCDATAERLGLEPAKPWRYCPRCERQPQPDGKPAPHVDGCPNAYCWCLPGDQRTHSGDGRPHVNSCPRKART